MGRHQNSITRRGALGLGLGAGALALAPRWASAQSLTLRYGHNNEPASVAGAQADWFAEAVAKHSGGDMLVQVFPSSQLGKLQELAEAVSLGTIAFSHNTAGGIGSLYEPFGALDTPYLYRDVDHLMKVMDINSPVMQELNQGLIEAANVRVIYAHYFGRRNLTANKAVYSPADLAGEKIRAVPFPIYQTAVEGMGAAPVPVDWSEVPTALATGIVAGQENPVNVILNVKLYLALIEIVHRIAIQRDHLPGRGVDYLPVTILGRAFRIPLRHLRTSGVPQRLALSSCTSRSRRSRSLPQRSIRSRACSTVMPFFSAK
jgi:TRAP-type transport system periplasmic protein